MMGAAVRHPPREAVLPAAPGILKGIPEIGQLLKGCEHANPQPAFKRK